MKKILYIALIMIASCGTKKDIQVNTIIPDLKIKNCDLTDKQWKKYLKFVKDSMKIEASVKKTEIKYEYKIIRDSFSYKKVVTKFNHKSFSDSLKHETKTKISDDKKEKTKARQENKKVSLISWLIIICSSISCLCIGYFISVIFRAIKNFPI